jgi:hypothetical protein
VARNRQPRWQQAAIDPLATSLRAVRVRARPVNHLLRSGLQTHYRSAIVTADFADYIEAVGHANRLGCNGFKHPGGASVRADRGGAALVCFQDRQISLMTFWPDLPAALQADRDRTPCGPDCQGYHAVVHRDHRGRLRTVQVRRPEADNVRRQLRAALNGDGQALDRLRQDLPMGES